MLGYHSRHWRTCENIDSFRYGLRYVYIPILSGLVGDVAFLGTKELALVFDLELGTFS